MKKVIALGFVTAFSCVVADQQNWNTANTFLRYETPFSSASPERLSLFNADDLRDKTRKHHNGDVQFAIFGGANTNRSDAAAYYMPGGLETLTFNSAVDANNQGTDTLMTYWSGAQNGVTRAQFGGDATNNAIAYSNTGETGTPVEGTPLSVATNAATDLAYNVGTGTQIVTATNDFINPTLVTANNTFVVGNGTVDQYEPYDLNGLRGLVDNTGLIGDFRLDTNKNIGVMRPWNFGVGYAPNVQMGSDVAQSEFISTLTPELRRSQWGIGMTWRQVLSDKNTGFFVELSTALQRVTMEMNLNENVVQELIADPSDVLADSWVETGGNIGNEELLQNMTQAFAQSAWSYGKVNGEHSVTRLADIELKVGYQFMCTENVLSNGFIGMVIPTGNKATAENLAETIVGNGFHFGLMTGSTAEIQLNSDSETRWSTRSDANFRYLFENTQMRSFDTNSNGQWSRYMMVWENYAAEQANGELGDGSTLRAYTPGINVFTKEMHVTPRSQARFNQALIMERGGFKGELGWNMLVRQAEEVELVTPWVDNSVAFVDASNSLSSMFNQTRTIYNDSYQSAPLATGVEGASQDMYNAASISAADLNLNSAASPAAFTNTPYLALGYAFNEEKSSMFTLGGSYEMSATNGYINSWSLWGKFSLAF